MAVAHGKPQYTYEDYAKLPEGERVELIGGEFLVSPSPRERHQRLSLKLGFALHSWVEERKLGRVYIAPFDVVLSRHDVVQPDILFIAKNRTSIITEANIQGAPDLIIEILSPESIERDTVIKKALYEKHGVKEYWIVDPDAQSISAYDLHNGGFMLRKMSSASETLESAVVTGFTVSVTSIFKP